jgi:hypothetical protein
MNADIILDALEMIDDKYILDAKELGAAGGGNVRSKLRSVRRTLILAAVIAAVLALCGFAAYEFGLFDPWLQKPSADPTETVQSAIENQIDKTYTISVSIDEIKVDDDETKNAVRRYSGSELARARGWTDKYLAAHFVAVRAKYYVEYDHTKTFMNDGFTEQYFYLTQDVRTGEWTIIDNTGPNT